MLTFFLQPIAYGSWLPNIPAIQQGLGLGPAELALALLGAPVGIVATVPFAGRLVARVGAKAALLLSFVVFLAFVAGPALATSTAMLFVALMVVGMAVSILEVGLNVEASRIEVLSGRLIMNTAHGCWSLGLTAGSLLGAGLAAIGMGPFGSIALVAVCVLPVALFVVRALPEAEIAVPSQESGTSSFTLRPIWPLGGVCAFVCGITMTEGAAADWAAIYMRDAIGVSGPAAGIAFSIFAAMVAGGRFLGDRLKRRFGTLALARGAGAVSLAGALILLVADATPVAFVGFAALGIGVSVGFPLSVSVVAGLAGRTPAANVAMLSLSAMTGFLVGPPLIGGAAQYLGIRIGFAMAVIPILLLSLGFAGTLGRPAAAASGGPPDPLPAPSPRPAALGD